MSEVKNAFSSSWALGPMATIRDFPDLYKRFYGRPNMTWGKTMAGHDISQENRNPLLGRVAGADGLEDGPGDRLISADRNWDHTCRHDLTIIGLDVGMALFKTEAAAHRNVADVRDFGVRERRPSQRVFVGPDPLDGSDRARAEASAGPIGHAQVHGDPDQRYVETAEIGEARRIGPVRSRQERRRLGKRPGAPVSGRERHLGHPSELRIEDITAG